MQRHGTGLIVWCWRERNTQGNWALPPFFLVDCDNAKERNENETEAMSFDSARVNANRITSIWTKRKRFQSTPEWMKSNTHKSGQCKGVRNVFNGLNHSMAGFTHTYFNKDTKL